MPPIMKVRAENEEHHPNLMEYRHSIRVLLNQYLALTLCEHLQILDLSGLDGESSTLPGVLMEAGSIVTTTSSVKSVTQQNRL